MSPSCHPEALVRILSIHLHHLLAPWPERYRGFHPVRGCEVSCEVLEGAKGLCPEKGMTKREQSV
jgi:hypothetical protein